MGDPIVLVRFTASDRGRFWDRSGGVGWSDFDPDLRSHSGLALGVRSGCLWDPIWGPSGKGQFRFGLGPSPHEDLLHGKPENFMS